MRYFGTMTSFDLKPVILAAGDSTRMGFPKALLPLGDGTFLTRILDTVQALSLQSPYVVLGRHAARIEPALAGRECVVLINPDPQKGQLSSIQLAVSHLDASCGGCLIWPVDHPAVSLELTHNLVRRFCESEAALAMPLHGQRRGHPAIFHRRLFDELLAEPVEKGLKDMVNRYRHETALLETDEAGTVADIDTPADFLKLTGETLEAALARKARIQPKG